MLLGKYRISTHAKKQYAERVNSKNVVKNIRRDLRTLNIRNIVYAEDEIFVFTNNYLEFVFAKHRDRERDLLVLKTVIARNRRDTESKISRRQRLVTN